jgi:hypothetical protein
MPVTGALRADALLFVLKPVSVVRVFPAKVSMPGRGNLFLPGEISNYHA